MRTVSVVQSVCLFFPKPTHLADFNQVQTIQYSNSEDKDRKGTLQLKIAGAPEVRRAHVRHGGKTKIKRCCRNDDCFWMQVKYSWVIRITAFSNVISVTLQIIMIKCPQE